MEASISRECNILLAPCWLGEPNRVLQPLCALAGKTVEHLPSLYQAPGSTPPTAKQILLCSAQPHPRESIHSRRMVWPTGWSVMRSFPGGPRVRLVFYPSLSSPSSPTQDMRAMSRR